MLLLTCTTGCSSGSELPGDTGIVRGNVTYKGQPIPEGSAVVMVHRERGIVGIGVTDSLGEFQIRMRGGHDVLVGEYDVHITPPGELDENVGTPTMDNVPETWKAVPMQYWTLDTSPEKFTVEPGENQYFLNLKDG